MVVPQLRQPTVRGYYFDAVCVLLEYHVFSDQAHRFHCQCALISFGPKPDNDTFGSPVDHIHLLDLHRPFIQVILVDTYGVYPQNSWLASVS